MSNVDRQNKNSLTLHRGLYLARLLCVLAVLTCSF